MNNLKIKILYEDKDVLVIDKPSGILTHPAIKSEGETILDWATKKYPKVELVHRLDKDTSGVLVLAKNHKAHEFLKKQFMDREVKKTYVAVVQGFVKKDHDIINKPIGRSPMDFRRHSASRGARGEMREAVTEYKVIKRFTSPQPSPSKGEGEKVGKRTDLKNSKRSVLEETFSQPFTYLEIHPKTGRTHQIRVHMKFLNHPVVCDSLYDPKGPCPKNISRLALHAKSIEFKTPKNKIIKVESSLPAFLKKIK